jgi:hypothetical protein
LLVGLVLLLVLFTALGLLIHCWHRRRQRASRRVHNLAKADTTFL